MKDKATKIAGANSVCCIQLEQQLSELKANYEALKHLIDTLPGDVYWKDRKGVWSGLNKRCIQSLYRMGFIAEAKEEQILGKTDYQIFDKNTADIYTQNDAEVVARGIELSREEVTLLPSGEEVVLLSTKKPMLNDRGETIGIIGNTIDITHLKKLEIALREAKNQAEAASIAKTEFIANMSHDIRTPLSGVIGLSEILERSLSNEIQKEQAHMLHDSGEELLSMLNGILDDVRADHVSEGDIVEHSFNLSECIGDLVRLERPTTTLKNLELAVAIDDSVPQYIVSDKKKIHRILLNLLGNAIKFTQSGKITLEVKCLDKNDSKAHLQFGVADTGIGIPKALQEKVFDRFFCVTSSYKGLYAGRGLGLHIVQSYVSLLGGHITLTSEEGVGSTFHFDVFCALGQPPSPSPLQKKSATPAPLPGPMPHILLVEDNPITLKLLETMVQSAGCTTDSAQDGEYGLELAQDKHFDLIITDIGLPGISGHELTQKIRAWEQTQNKSPVRIVGLTGHARDSARQECLASGMDEVYTKPINQSFLQEMASSLIMSDGTQVIQDKPLHSATPKEPGLGPDLPKTEAELFQLDAYLLFNPKEALKQLTMPLLLDVARAYATDDFQTDIRQIEQAHEIPDWDEVKRLAHKIKSGVSYIGAEKMRYACQYLECYHLAGNTALLEELYQQLMKTHELTIEALKDWLAIYDKK